MLSLPGLSTKQEIHSMTGPVRTVTIADFIELAGCGILMINRGLDRILNSPRPVTFHTSRRRQDSLIRKFQETRKVSFTVVFA